LDDLLLQLGEGLVYFALIALVFMSGVAVLFAIPVVFFAEALRGDYVSALQGIGLEIIAIYLARGGMNILKQVKLNASDKQS
jgi:hypothetical protein